MRNDSGSAWWMLQMMDHACGTVDGDLEWREQTRYKYRLVAAGLWISQSNSINAVFGGAAIYATSSNAEKIEHEEKSRSEQQREAKQKKKETAEAPRRHTCPVGYDNQPWCMRCIRVDQDTNQQCLSQLVPWVIINLHPPIELGRINDTKVQCDNVSIPKTKRFNCLCVRTAHYSSSYHQILLSLSLLSHDGPSCSEHSSPFLPRIAVSALDGQQEARAGASTEGKGSYLTWL